MRPGLRRLRLLTNFQAGSPPNYQYAELHADGAAVAVHRLVTGRDAPREGEPLPVRNVPLVWTAAQALNVVAKHAINVGAWGELAVELMVFGPPRVLAWVAFGHVIEHIEAARVLDDDVVSQHTFALFDLTAGVQPLLAAARRLLTDVFNAFGSPEIRALTPGGALNTRYLGGDQELRTWAARNDVAIE